MRTLWRWWFTFVYGITAICVMAPPEAPFWERLQGSVMWAYSIFWRQDPFRLVMLSNLMDREIRDGGHSEEIKDAYAEVSLWLKAVAEAKEPGVIRRTWKITQELVAEGRRLREAEEKANQL